MKSSPERIKELIALAKAKNKSHLIKMQNQYGEVITLNDNQSKAVKIATEGKSCCIIGAAGSGKTTATKAIVANLVKSNIGLLVSDGHKYLMNEGSPAIAGIAFTRTAVNNLKKSMPSDMRANCMTFHAILEYSPIYTTTIDNEGNETTVKTFEPKRHTNNPIDNSLKVIIIDEASMPSVELFKLLLDALQHRVQFIFLGDINQLPPVFGTAILGYAMLALPTIELTEIYRNAGPIVHLAHRIKSGKPLLPKECPDYEVENKVRIQHWKRTVPKDDAVELACMTVINLIDSGEYNYKTDMILCPFNVSFGTDEINAHIANHLSTNPTYEVITGFSTKYLAVGDRVMHTKLLGTITAISANLGYSGKKPQPSSVHLNRWGILTKAPEANQDNLPSESAELDIDSMLEAFSMTKEPEEAKRASSHVITIELDALDSESEPQEVTLHTAGAVNNLNLAYAMTVHKSQGSEFNKVMLLLHSSHACMLTRELLYTAVTRAKNSVHIICEKDTLVKGILRQAITGDTLEEKAEFFKGKATNDKSIEKGLRWN